MDWNILIGDFVFPVPPLIRIQIIYSDGWRTFIHERNDHEQKMQKWSTRNVHQNRKTTLELLDLIILRGAQENV